MQWMQVLLNPTLELCRGQSIHQVLPSQKEIAPSMQDKTSSNLQIRREPSRSKKKICFFFIRSPRTMCTYAEPQRGWNLMCTLSNPQTRSTGLQISVTFKQQRHFMYQSTQECQSMLQPQTPGTGCLPHTPLLVQTHNR